MLLDVDMQSLEEISGVKASALIVTGCLPEKVHGCITLPQFEHAAYLFICCKLSHCGPILMSLHGWVMFKCRVLHLLND